MKKQALINLRFFTRLGSMRPERYACAFFARNCRGPLQLRAFAARARENSSSSVFETRSANKDIKRHNFAIKFNEAGAYHKMQPTSTSQDVCCQLPRSRLKVTTFSVRRSACENANQQLA